MIGVCWFRSLPLCSYSTVSHKVPYILECSVCQCRTFCLLTVTALIYWSRYSFTYRIFEMPHYCSHLNLGPHFLFSSSGPMFSARIFSWKICKVENRSHKLANIFSFRFDFNHCHRMTRRNCLPVSVMTIIYNIILYK